MLQKHKWENAMTIDKSSWGYRRNAVLSDYMSTAELVQELVVTVSCGGNLLMNVGPTKDGIIPPIYEERLRGMGNLNYNFLLKIPCLIKSIYSGQWLEINGEAIYGSRPWKYQNDTLTGDTWYTTSKDGETLYAIILSWPKNDILHLGAANFKDAQLSLLGFSGEFEVIFTLIIFKDKRFNLFYFFSGTIRLKV